MEGVKVSESSQMGQSTVSSEAESRAWSKHQYGRNKMWFPFIFAAVRIDFELKEFSHLRSQVSGPRRLPGKLEWRARLAAAPHHLPQPMHRNLQIKVS